MPLATKRIDRHLVEFAERLTVAEIDDLASDPDIRRLQCASPVEAHTWNLLNKKFFPSRPEVELRVYGFYSSTCDLSFVTRLQNVRRFSADCLMEAGGVEHLSALEQLEELSIGIYSLESLDFLKAMPKGLKSLSVGATKSKKPRLEPVVRFQALNRLYIEGQEHGISAIAELHELEDLTLRSISTPNLDYVSRLPRLRSLDIKLGGIRNLSAIEGKDTIQYLELWRIRGLSDISVISSLTGLQHSFSKTCEMSVVSRTYQD
jgi:hypothetical protein